MYKVSSVAVPRTTLPSIQKTFFYQQDADRTHRPAQQAAALKSEKAEATKELKRRLQTMNCGELTLPSLGRRRRQFGSPSSTPSSTPSTPSCAEIEQQMNVLDKSWKAFCQTESGELDQSIEEYRPAESSLPADFQPLDLDTFLAQRILKQVDIDFKMLFH